MTGATGAGVDQEIFGRLAALPELGLTNAILTPCKVCGGKASFFDVVDFNKCCSQADFYCYGQSGVPVTYFRCSNCGFVFTNFFDDWMVGDFARFVYNGDYIKVDGEYAGRRPERDAATLARRLDGLTGLRILDYGSGSGLLAEHLRMQGCDNVISYDPFSSPRRPDGGFDVVTCFEVLEHTTTPRTTIADIASLLDPGGCVFFSTGIQPQNIGLLRANWWYVAPRNGHASIYTLNALALAGQSAGLTLHSGSGGTAFAGSAASPTSERLLSSIGPACRFLRLTAPGDDSVLADSQKTSWHGVEGSGPTSYRWTREADIVWRVQSPPLGPCKLTVTIPIRMEVQPGFADGCRLTIGNGSVALVREIGDLKASVTLDEYVDPIIRLVTPPLLRPCDLRASSDERSLGLAITTESGEGFGNE
jgi:2-polyprenyl-6-hydroxyphenyl methylase/3-demethylubiquinone-9 3-methyltransferase